MRITTNADPRQSVKTLLTKEIMMLEIVSLPMNPRTYKEKIAEACVNSMN